MTVATLAPRARRKDPVHQIVRDNVVLSRAFARELGLTPSGRSGRAGHGRSVTGPLGAFWRSSG